MRRSPASFSGTRSRHFAKPLSDGAQVQVYGQVSVFEARGQYQLSVQILQTRGLGLLQAKFEALKRKLEAEGLFDPARKRPLPRFPKRIGIVTSPSGAAIRDILNVLQRRAPGLEILINPVRVQGIGAAAEIAVAIRELARPNESWKPLDLIVVTRGGGSIEDLWEFNEEIVARAIFEAPIPVVSAVGHEIDFTIADFVADLRAPTPSAAAELIIPDANDILRRVAELSSRLDRNLRNFLSQNQTRLRFLSERTLSRELMQRMRNAQQALDLATDSLTRRAARAILDARAALASAAQKLQAHSPAREIAAAPRPGSRFAKALRRAALAAGGEGPAAFPAGGRNPARPRSRRDLAPGLQHHHDGKRDGHQIDHAGCSRQPHQDARGRWDDLFAIDNGTRLTARISQGDVPVGFGVSPSGRSCQRPLRNFCWLAASSSRWPGFSDRSLASPPFRMTTKPLSPYGAGAVGAVRCRKYSFRSRAKMVLEASISLTL